MERGVIGGVELYRAFLKGLKEREMRDSKT